jgi:hypothetical protein
MMAWLGGIADWIAEHATVVSAIISAIATGVVAWFTIKLTAATAGLRDVADQQQRDTAAALKLTRDSLALARDEFNATHRPKLVVQSVQFVNVVVPADKSETIGAWVRLANTGETAATDFRVHGFITRQKLPLDSGIPIPTQKSDVTELESSERTLCSFRRNSLWAKNKLSRTRLRKRMRTVPSFAWERSTTLMGAEAGERPAGAANTTPPKDGGLKQIIPSTSTHTEPACLSHECGPRPTNRQSQNLTHWSVLAGPAYARPIGTEIMARPIFA